MEKVEIPVMGEKEFEEHVHSIARTKFVTYAAFSKFKSVNRAIRRGLVSPLGIIYPKRPYNNRKETKGRMLNRNKKSIYERIKQFEGYSES
jgi:hypothetical protein